MRRVHRPSTRRSRLAAATGLYMKPPFMPGAATQGYQLPDAPAARYRAGLKALAAISTARSRANLCNELSSADQDKVLAGLEFGIDRARRRQRRTVLRVCCWKIHDRRIFCGSDLWRQSEHGRMETGWISRCAIRLSRLGRAPQRTLSAAARQHHGSVRLVGAGISHGAQASGKRRRDHRARMDRIHPRLMSSRRPDSMSSLIERGPWRDTATDFPPAYVQDEFRYAIRLDLFLRPDQETLTFRNNAGQTALPIRSFLEFSSRQRCGRRRRSLERPDLALPSVRFSACAAISRNATARTRCLPT